MRYATYNSQLTVPPGATYYYVYPGVHVVVVALHVPHVHVAYTYGYS